MPRGAVTKARNLQLYNDGPVKEWMDIQNSLGSSIGQSITFITALYGEVDLPSTLPKIRANQQMKFNNSNLKMDKKATISKMENLKPRLKQLEYRTIVKLTLGLKHRRLLANQ